MRECIRDSPWLGPLVDELKKTNSRLCSPRDLHAIVLPYSREAPNSELDASFEPPSDDGGRDA